ncbi:MarR family winged helix-turn-helix transcriptional regulator [Chitiniphilus eburneus]|uniref:MarR family transcriptional regulator n=1 Tax=Chitiniphilus eburneus TaxID=2571148 RepID=A0A4V5MQN8_9NEIS|nr:MarR family transcriptional regulator [Chitiniphilus eburneus]TJZ73288.1 MarR family transcriptional regulator [Chitiniphilus eburneus]
MSFEQRIEQVLGIYPNAPGPALRASRLLFRVGHLLEARINAALVPHGLDMRGYLALVVLDTEGPSLNPSELGVTLDASRVQVTRLLDRLENAGLLQRQHSSRDRRSLDLELTDTGRARYRHAMADVHAAYAACWSALQPERIDALVTDLAAMNDALEPQQP